jgi:hypothetical protein
MTNNISSTSPANQAHLQQAQQARQQQAKQNTQEPKDTVTLSPQAKGASSDTDHDGH